MYGMEQRIQPKPVMVAAHTPYKSQTNLKLFSLKFTHFFNAMTEETTNFQ